MRAEPAFTLDELAAQPERAQELPPRATLDLLAKVAGLQTTLLVRIMSLANGASPAQESVERDRLLTVPEVADLLRIAKGHAYDLARRGEIPTVRFGKYVRVRLASLQEWWARHENKGLDRVLYRRYSAHSDRRRATAVPAKTRTDSSPVRPKGRRGLQQRRPVGTGRAGDFRTSGSAHSAAGEDGAEKA